MALIGPKRRSLRLKDYDYSQAGAYFMTLCVKDRKCLLGSVADGEITFSQYGLITAEFWEWLSSAYPHISLDEWTIMPNHLHGIIIISNPCRGGSRAAPTRAVPTSEIKIKPLGQIIGAFKTISSKQINIHRQTPGAPFWQRGFYEHIIRDEKSLERIREYIVTNPLRWQLDRENQQATGKDEFDGWLTRFHQKPATKAIEL